MERHCFMKVRILWLIAFLLFTVQLSAQQKVTVKGKITDEHNEPVIGANIMEKGTTNGVISDFDGFFTLNVSSGATLVVSYIGFAQQEIPVKDKRDFVIRLAEDSETLNEVVVIGYGSARKRDLWLSGNFWLLSFKISYLCLPLFYETRTTPSCHPSGCAYRQL